MLSARKFVVATLAAAVQACSDPDCDLTFVEICQKNNFKVETHQVTTEDGYILTLMRIPGIVGEQVTTAKPPVFF